MPVGDILDPRFIPPAQQVALLMDGVWEKMTQLMARGY